MSIKNLYSLWKFFHLKEGKYRIHLRYSRAAGTLQSGLISVTYGAGGNLQTNSTCEIASRIKKQYGIESVAHLTCVNSSKRTLKRWSEDWLKQISKNVLALRGDISEDGEMKHDFHHANELAIEVQRKCRDNLEILGAMLSGRALRKQVDWMKISRI